MSEPTPLMKRQAVIDWLHEEHGIAPYTTRQLIEGNQIKGRPLPGRTYNLYSRAQIEADILKLPQSNQSKSGEGPASSGATKQEH